jgi:hypothetical protein
MTLTARLTVTPILAAATLALLVACAPSAAARTSTCREEGSTTLGKSRHARVYEFQGDVYGCLFSENTPHVLIVGTDCDVAGRGAIRLAGRYVGVARTFCNIDQAEDRVQVTDLRTGQELVSTGASPTFSASLEIGSVYVTDLELKANGSVAWIAKLKVEGTPTEEEVRKSDRTIAKGPRTTSKLLDAGKRIASRSLTREGSTVSWTSAGVEKTARLK